MGTIIFPHLSSSSEAVRQAVEAVRSIEEAGGMASLARIAEFLTLPDSEAARARCERAEQLGLIVNAEPSPDRLPVYTLAVQRSPPARRIKRAMLIRWLLSYAARQRPHSTLLMQFLNLLHRRTNREQS